MKDISNAIAWWCALAVAFFLGLELARIERDRDDWRARAESCADTAEEAVGTARACNGVLSAHLESHEACSCWVVP